MKNFLQAFGGGRQSVAEDDTSGRYAVLDVGTSSVKALIVEVDGDRVVVLGSGRHAQEFGAMRDSLITDLSSVVACANAALSDAEEMAGGQARSAIIGLPAEQTRGVSGSLSQERKHPASRIMAPELEELLRQSQRQALNEVGAQLALEAHVDSLDVRLINAVATMLSVDGHTVRNPIGFQGKYLTVATLDAVAKLIHVGAMQTLASSLDLTVAALIAEPFALANALASPLVRELGAVYIDVGAGSTSVTLVREGRIVAYKSLPKGGLAFTRAIALLGNLSPQAADDRKLAFARGLLNDKETADVAGALEGDMDDWAAAVGSILRDMASDERLPSFVHLCGGSCGLPGLSERLSAFVRRADSPFSGPPRIAALGVNDLGLSIEPHVGQPDVQDIMVLTLARQALSIEAVPNEVDELLIKISRALGPA